MSQANGFGMGGHIHVHAGAAGASSRLPHQEGSARELSEVMKVASQHVRNGLVKIEIHHRNRILHHIRHTLGVDLERIGLGGLDGSYHPPEDPRASNQVLIAAAGAWRKVVLRDLKQARKRSVEHRDALSKAIEQVQLGHVFALLSEDH